MVICFFFCIILKVFLFTWHSNYHRDPATTSLIPLSIIPLPWSKLKSPSFFFPATYWPNQETQLFNGDLLVFALFLFSSSIKGLKIKQHKPLIYVFLFQDWPCAWQQISQPVCLCRASFHWRLEHLQTSAHYREDEERRREAESQKPHLKKNRVSFGFYRVARVMGRPVRSPGFCRVVAPAGLLTNLNRSSHRVDPPSRSGFNNYVFCWIFCFYPFLYIVLFVLNLIIQF